MSYQFKEVDEATIRPFLEHSIRGSFAQSIEMAGVRADAGRDIHYIAVYDGAAIVVGAQLSLIGGRFPSADITAGPLFASEHASDKLIAFFTDSVREYLAAKGCVYLTISPNMRYSERLVKQFKDSGWEYSGRINATKVGIRGGIRWIYIKNLEGQTEENYQAAYAKRHRRYIRNHDPHLTLRRLARDELSIFTHIMRHTAERRQFVSRNDAYFESLYDRFGDNIAYHVVELAQNGKNIPIAAIAFVEKNGEIVSYLGGALSEYARYRASYLLHDAMILRSIQKGYPRYNFYGIEGNIDDPQSDGYGIYEFKAKFGTGEPVELIGEFVLPIKKPAYQLFKTLRRIKK